jgi:hypothetical protein
VLIATGLLVRQFNFDALVEPCATFLLPFSNQISRNAWISPQRDEYLGSAVM